MPSVLIVDDLPSFHEMLDVVVQPVGFTTAFATDGVTALERFRKERFDLVLADFQMSPMDGITLLREIKKVDPNAVVIIMTAHAAKENAMAALKYGAFDFLQKPFRVDELIRALKRALEFRQLAAAKPRRGIVSSVSQPIAPDSAEASDTVETLLTGESRKIKRIARQLRKMLEAKTPLLVTGEVGTGKKAIAEYIFSQGAAKDGSFVRYDCSLVEEVEFQSGLIGPKGLGGAWIEEAKNGVLFLEHVQSMPSSIQRDFASVLRATGSSVRLICSSTEDLETLSEQKKFHDELFFRIAALPLALPSLRERIEDIPALVKAIAAGTDNPKFASGRIEFTSDAIGILSAYFWPGNFSELSMTIGRIVSESETRVITAEQLPLHLHDLKDYPSLAEYLQGQRQQYVERVLHVCGGDTAKAGKILKCDLSGLKA